MPKPKRPGDTKNQRAFMLRMRTELYNRADAFAKTRGATLSGILRIALGQYLDREEK